MLSIPFRIPVSGRYEVYRVTWNFQFLSGFQNIGAEAVTYGGLIDFQFLSGFQRSLITVGYGSIYVYPIIFSTFVEIYCS